MGSIRFSISDYFDTVTETVGIKSGLLLTSAEAVKILKENFSENFFDHPNLEDGIRIRSEVVESHIQWVRYKIGNLSEEQMNPLRMSDALMKWMNAGFDPIATMKIFIDIMGSYKGKEVDPLITIKQVQERIKVPEEMIIEIAILLAEHQFASSHVNLPQIEQWDGGKPLSDLFHCELKSKENFLDQEFLDYLAKNSEDLELIHWRNFERMCAEYFKRLGFEIVLGPGTNDGGVDIRAFSKKDKQQPLLLIQCKRHAKDNIVDIPTVKAFYSDVEFEKAKHGLIATTSYIAKGGKKVASARNYPLSFAENEDVKKWALSMWRYSK